MRRFTTKGGAYSVGKRWIARPPGRSNAYTLRWNASASSMCSASILLMTRSWLPSARRSRRANVGLHRLVAGGSLRKLVGRDVEDRVGDAVVGNEVQRHERICTAADVDDATRPLSSMARSMYALLLMSSVSDTS